MNNKKEKQQTDINYFKDTESNSILKMLNGTGIFWKLFLEKVELIFYVILADTFKSFKIIPSGQYGYWFELPKHLRDKFSL